MRHTTWLIIIFSLIFCMSIYLSSILWIVEDTNFHSEEFSKIGTYSRVPNADEINLGIIRYFQDKGDFSDDFDDNEESHLNDVKNLVKTGHDILIILSITNMILLSIILFNSKNIKKESTKILLFSSIPIILLPFIFLFVDFSSLFLKFHELLFPNGNFLFLADSLLIKLYPERFFYDSFKKITIFSASFGCILLAFWVFLSRKR